MKGFLTEDEILNSKPTRYSYYGIIKTKKNKLVIAEIVPGVKYFPLVKLDFKTTEAMTRFCRDIYQQLKSSFEGISKHH